MWMLAALISDLPRSMLHTITFLIFLALATKTVTILILYGYCRGVRKGYVANWTFQLEVVRRYIAAEPIEDIRGPGTIDASPCFGGVPGPKS
jgi:hypothetical protein